MGGRFVWRVSLGVWTVRWRSFVIRRIRRGVRIRPPSLPRKLRKVFIRLGLAFDLGCKFLFPKGFLCKVFHSNELASLQCERPRFGASWSLSLFLLFPSTFNYSGMEVTNMPCGCCW